MRKTISLVCSLLLLLTLPLAMAKDYGDYNSAGWGKMQKCIRAGQLYQGDAAGYFCECVGGDWIRFTPSNMPTCAYQGETYNARDYFWYLLRLTPYCNSEYC